MTQQRNTDFRTHIWNFSKKAEKRLKRLTQQCNTDFHTSTFYHQKSWVSFLYMSLLWCNNATQNLKRTYKILGKKAKKGWRNNATLIFEHIYQFFLKSWEKAEKADATTQHWFSHIHILAPKRLSFLLIHESSLMQQCNTELETHLWNFWKKSWKGWSNNATLISEHIYQI